MAGLAIAAAALTGVLVRQWSERSTPPSESASTQEASSSHYVDPATCNTCHEEIGRTYAETGMGRSFRRLQPDDRIDTPGPAEPVYHEASNRYYTHVLRDGRYYQRRFQRDSKGRETNVLEKEIHFVMGSGNHARSFLHMSPSGTLRQLPLGWYSEGGGRWAMSPGYDRPNHDGFQRVISFDCMFCHNAYPEIGEGKDHPGMRPQYLGSLPEGIDCQRCHGPGSAHVDAATSGSTDTAQVIASIVNPARLPADRQREVCFQCHLEPTSRPLPNIVHRYGRGYFSFRPGERLSDYAIYFDHAEGTGWDDKFEINHSAYRLMQSKCFVESGDAITCTTCHDPHMPSGAPEASRRYNDACMGCHAGGLEGMIAVGDHTASSECTACHMPKRRTDDVVHAVMTDHRIQSRPPRGLTRAKAERSTLADTRYRGNVDLYFPATLTGSVDELYEALAQVAQGSNLEAGIRRLEAAITHHRPEEAGFYFELAAALEEAGRLESASRWFERAIEKDPGFALAKIRLGTVLSRASQHERADAVLRQAAGLDPADPRVPKERGLNFARQGLYGKAVDASRAGIALDPELPELHNNLGGALAEMGQLDEAESALREAIRLQPDLAEARFNLGAILAGRGDHDGAAAEWREALRGDPEYVAARYNLAVLLAQAGDRAAAVAHLNAAMEADPAFEQARTLRDQLRGIAARTEP